MIRNTKLWAYLLGVKDSLDRSGVGMSYEDLALCNAYDSGRNFGDDLYAFFNPGKQVQFVIVYDHCYVRCIEALDYTHAETKALRGHDRAPAWIVETNDVCEAMKDYIENKLRPGVKFNVTRGP